MKYKLIIFDWDGTIMDSMAHIVQSVQRAATDLGLEVPADNMVRQNIGLSIGHYIEQTFSDIDLSLQEKFVQQYRQHFFDDQPHNTILFDGVKVVLAELQAQDYLMAVATGKSRYGLDIDLNNAQLKQFFVTTRCADEAYSKPHPQMLYDILDFTGLEAEQALMVGDTTFDLEMAQSANMDALAVSYGAHAKEELLAQQPIACIDHIRELLDTLSGFDR